MTTAAQDASAVERYFRVRERGSTVRREILAGFTTFLAMAYILFVNPIILGEAGMDTGAVFVATAIAACTGTLIMGLWARLPIAQAPGMGLNAFFAFTVVLGMGIPWETALTATFLSGLVFLLLALTGVRGVVINAIPMELKLAVGAGIGLFIAFIGLQNAGIVVPDESTAVALGALGVPTTLLAIFGILATVAFMLLDLRGAVFLGIVATAAVGMLFGVIAPPSAILSAPPSVAPTFGALVPGFADVFSGQMLIVVFTMLFVDFFDTSGTLIAVANQAGLLDEGGNLPQAKRALTSDAVATMGGAVFGTSTTTSYIESAAGVGAGGRTGLTSVATAAFFALALLFSPLLAVVTEAVTAPALIVVGVLMASSLGGIAWDRLEVAIPAFITIAVMPLTYSIANGIAMGLVLFPLCMVVKGRAREVHPILYGLLVVLLAYFVFLVD